MNSWHQDYRSPPWRPLDNRERRAAWAARYFLAYEPGQHPRPPVERAAHRMVESHGTGIRQP